jgi:GNAT superfamily N-acetyltransferase
MSKNQVRTVTFDPRYLPEFVELNREWIETHFEIEETDTVQLKKPRETILDLGGEIFFVLENEKAVATCAMIPHGKHGFELAKMAVSPASRGKGYGDVLMSTAVSWAKAKGALEITLLSNTLLEPAISLYRKHGFEVVHLGDHPDYKRCNIEMVLKLAK